MALYMKYGSLDGACTTKGFEKWIELNSFQWGVGRAIGTGARGSLSREHSEPTISEITVTKLTDKSSPKLFEEALYGKLDTKVEIKFTTTVKNSVETFLAYELTNTGPSHYSLGSGGDMPTETLSLNFTKVQMKFTPMEAGLTGSPEQVGYDLEKMQKL
ncbi:MAG: type VI secretion system tube protein Hcp [Alphaproteobacteria bacterium]|nr:type VI secretion system tube protein Hcp [Alphaproteobacteria bacterium]MBV9584158.1 type VI secretion system tube protein Hcp [Alphaproteobacteria bacterium]